MLVQHRPLRIVCAAISDGARYLITQRQASASFPLLWEFPGGRVKADEQDSVALAQALRDRLGVEAQVVERLGLTEHSFVSHMVHLALYRCELGPTPPRAKRVRAFAWVKSSEFGQYEFVPADQSAMGLLLR